MFTPVVHLRIYYGWVDHVNFSLNRKTWVIWRLICADHILFTRYVVPVFTTRRRYVTDHQDRLLPLPIFNILGQNYCSSRLIYWYFPLIYSSCKYVVGLMTESQRGSVNIGLSFKMPSKWQVLGAFALRARKMKFHTIHHMVIRQLIIV